MGSFQFCRLHPGQKAHSSYCSKHTWTESILPWPLWRSVGQPTRNSGLDQSVQEEQRKLISNFVRANYKYDFKPLSLKHKMKAATILLHVVFKLTPFSFIFWKGQFGQLRALWNCFFLSHTIFGNVSILMMMVLKFNFKRYSRFTCSIQ